jgi:hypothetical protein
MKGQTMAANFFKVKNGLSLPVYANLAALQSVSSPANGDIACVGGTVYSYNGSASSWGQLGATTVPFKAVTADYTLTSQDYFISASGASALTMTLPSAVTAGAGRVYAVKSMMNSNVNLTVAAASGQTIDGSATVVLEQYQMVQLVSDGTQWLIG